MKSALFSDIHGDYQRLLAVMHDIEKQGCDRLICLGDIVNGGIENLEVAQHLKALNIDVVRGNHDEYPSASLPCELRVWLRELPEEIVEGDIVYTHVSPRIKKRKVRNDIEVWNVFDETKFRRIFIGDVHVPLIWGEKCASAISATAYPIQYDKQFVFAPDDRYLICVGAVGYSRDHDSRPRYVIYDEEEDSISFRVVDI